MSTKAHFAKHTGSTKVVGKYDFIITRDDSNPTVRACNDKAFAEMSANVPAEVIQNRTAPLNIGAEDDMADGLRSEGWKVQIVSASQPVAA